MPATPKTTSKPKPAAHVWVYNRVATDSNGHVHAGFMILDHQVKDGDRVHSFTHAVPPGLSRMDSDTWAKSVKGSDHTIGPRTVRLVDLDGLSPRDAGEMLGHSADGPSLKLLAERGGHIGELAVAVLEAWGDGERSHMRAVLETLAAGSDRAPN